MSLFPAYSELSQEKEQNPVQGDNWLENSSFPTAGKEKDERRDDRRERSSSSRHSSRSKSKSKKKKKKKRVSPPKEIKVEKIDIFEGNSDFFTDKTGLSGFSGVKTLPKTMRPRYSPLYPGLFPVYVLHAKKKAKRYFKNLGSSKFVEEGTLEDETVASKKREEFNVKLSDDPHDINTWIEFVKFQDEFYQNQHIKYKSLTERDRAAAQHKLSILDKAVAHNPENKELQALWLKIGTYVLPSEEMSKRIDKILLESGGTMTLWLGLMTTTQYSLARCTVPSVSQLFEKLLLNFQNDKKFGSHSRDKNVLELLFHYGRFLDHCGQWETLWMIIQVTLQFNTRVKLEVSIPVDEKVKRLEDDVVKEEKRAVWQLWSQLERIREGLHFLPDSESVDYPQRCILPENVVNFTWHFHPDLHFQLIVSFIVLLKIPLLPSTHSILKLLAPNCLPWVFDSPEFILSSLLISPAINLQYNYLYPISQLSRGPQYLRRLCGQQEFLDLITHVFNSCLQILEGRQKTALGVWWLRFERWIHLLSKLNLASLPENRKSAKNTFKDFLATEENRENLLYYTEYCLLQFNQGNVSSCNKALKTLIASRPPVLSLLEKSDERNALMAVYRTFCEVLIGTNQRTEAINLLINLGNGMPVDNAVTIHSLLSAEKKFRQVGVQLLEEIDSEAECSLEDMLLPNFIIDWISCYIWLMALTKSTFHLRNGYGEFFTLLEDKSGLMVEQIRECLWETILTVTWVFERNNLLYVKSILSKSHSSFYDNWKILSFLADNSLENSQLWLTIRKSFLSPPTTTGCVFLACVALERFNKDKENFQNRMKNLFQDLALRDGKLSALLHSLRLRYLFEYDNEQLDVAQLQALDSCPWNKSIYMESILLLPAKLMQLTDILVEKELKIHITPDEIQEMRD